MKKASGGIDYSKWDKMDFSDDDEESTDSAQRQVPRVTRLDEPSRVTCNPDGSVNITEATTATPNEKSQSQGSYSLVEQIAFTSSSEAKSNDTSVGQRIGLLTRNGGSFLDPSTNVESFWSQDRHEVVFCVAFDPSKIMSRDICVKVKGALNFVDRFAAVGGDKVIDSQNTKSKSKGEINITTVNGSNIFRGHLAYSIYLPEGEEEVDWEIDATDPRKKLIKITLLKALPMQGLTIWWSKPMLNYPEIDVLKDIEGRGDQSGREGTTTQSKQEQMKATWDEAHRLFREKIKKREKQSINITS